MGPIIFRVLKSPLNAAAPPPADDAPTSSVVHVRCPPLCLEQLTGFLLEMQRSSLGILSSPPELLAFFLPILSPGYLFPLFSPLSAEPSLTMTRLKTVASPARG